MDREKLLKILSGQGNDLIPELLIDRMNEKIGRCDDNILRFLLSNPVLLNNAVNNILPDYLKKYNINSISDKTGRTFYYF